MNLTKIYLYIWKFWEKSIFVHLLYWFFVINLHRKSKNLFPAFPLAFPIWFLHFSNVWRTQHHIALKKRLFWKENLGVRECELGRWVPDDILGSWVKSTQGITWFIFENILGAICNALMMINRNVCSMSLISFSLAVIFIINPRSYSKPLETLISLQAYGLGSYGQKKDQKLAWPPSVLCLKKNYWSRLS